MSDVMLQPDRDAPELDQQWVPIAGAALAAQDIIETLNTPIGSLPWDRAEGSDLLDQLNSGDTPPDAIRAELRRVATETPGVVPSTVVTSYNPETRQYRLSFQGEDGKRQLIESGLAR